VIPLGDDNSLRKSTPVITYLLILVNILVFFLELGGGEEFIMKWAFIPSHFIADPSANFPTLFTAMFMHAGWGHLIGNMLYLWIFGDNVEDQFGRIKFLVFYLVCGVVATLAQLFFDPHSNVPNLGASGAIAGVLGAYILFFPQGKVNVLLGSYVTQMSALLVIGFWFLLQFFSGLSSPVDPSGRGEAGGVAYMAHIGGFIAGLLVAIAFRASERANIRK
jgi:membrane associated rhomboid family serine protease